ncbi:MULTISPECIES: glycosyltransferase [Listeria]|uniref:glycosyltransferase n=1 Tax=Listeria TaxID=1637 RepID=UPI000B5873F8|nr:MULTISPECIES: glycosyltransferase [Listeria]
MKNKKVLFFVTEFPTLSETFILNQITGAIDLGCEVQILALKQGNIEKVHADVQNYKLLEKVTYLNIPSSKKERLKLTLKGIFTKPAIALKGLNRKRYGKIVWTLAPTICMQKVRASADLIVSHYGNVGLIASILQDTGFLKGEQVTFFHGYDLTRTINQKGKQYYKFLFKTNTKLLPISIYWRQQLIKLGANKEKIQVHHMGIDTKTFDFYPAVETYSDVRLLIVARLTPKKGIADAIKTVKILKAKGMDVVLNILGDGDERFVLKELAEKLDVMENVRFHGFKEQKAVKEMFMHSDIFLLPSITAPDGDMEGIPVSLMEAMAQGKPVISTVHSGIPELIDDKKSGFLVPENSPEEIANAIICYTELDEQKKLDMLTEARKKVETEFNIHMLNEKLF